MSDARNHDRPAASSNPPATAARAPATPLHIDIRQLHLHGYTPLQQQRFVQALESALARLAHDADARASTSLSLPRLDLRHAAASPEDAAQQLARRLFDRSSATRRRDHG
jgi:hypothetical protein